MASFSGGRPLRSLRVRSLGPGFPRSRMFEGHQQQMSSSLVTPSAAGLSAKVMVARQAARMSAKRLRPAVYWKIISSWRQARTANAVVVGSERPGHCRPCVSPACRRCDS
jgi:hypothetical protein